MPGTDKIEPKDTQKKIQERTRLDGNSRSTPPRHFAWIASLATISLIMLTQLVARGDNPYLRGVGVFTLVLAGVFAFLPFVLLAKHGRIRDGGSYMQTSVVVDRGLYAISRHPQYLGYMLFAGGFALLSQHWAVVLLAVIGVMGLYFQALQEERYCLTRLGEPYNQYLRRVPRFNFLLGILRLLWKSNSKSQE
jgi:protein-S-isoprenylcysteine O-methyltransferase Ste14